MSAVQKGNMFELTRQEFVDIFDWLRYECKWKYDIEWLDAYYTKAGLQFSDTPGALEFKLRFC